jgi:diguanylate cyclase (GGDEF)-like protein/PAS domain S-box-containing protein
LANGNREQEDTRAVRATCEGAELVTTNTEAVPHHELDGPPALLRADIAGTVLDVDARLARHLGRTVDELVGRSALTWIHPEDVATTITVVSAVVEVAEARCPMRIRVADADGRWTLMACSVENHLGDPDQPAIHVRVRRSRTAAIDADGTVRRRDGRPDPIEPNPIAALSDSPTECGLLLSSSEGVTFVSPLLSRLLIRPLPDLLASYGDLFHPDEQDVAVDFVDRLFTNGDHPVMAQLRVVRGDGSWGRFQIASANLANDPDFNCFVTLVRSLDVEDGATTAQPVAVELDSRRQEIRLALNLAADPVLSISDVGTIRFASSPAGVLFETTVGALIARPFASLLDPTSVPDWERWIVGDRPPTLRLLARTTSGSQRWIDLRLLDEQRVDDPRPDHHVVVLHDVHDLALAELALAQREARFTTLVRNAGGGVVVLDDDDAVTGYGYSTEHVLGLRSDLLDGVHLAQWVHADDRSELAAALARVRAQTDPVTTIVRQRVASGNLRWIAWTLADHRDDPSVGGVVANLMDRTDEMQAHQARRESEQRFRALVQHSFEITIVLDDDFTVDWASPSVTQLLGWDLERVTGMNALDFVHPDDVDLVLANFEASIAGVTPRPFTIVRVREVDGTWHHMVASAADRRDDPEVGGIIVNLRDAHDQVTHAKALAESESRYRTLVQNSTDVVQIMSASAKVLWVSPAVENVLGWTPEQIIDEPVGSLSGLSGREELVEAFLSVLGEPGATARTIGRVQHANGSWRWVDVVLVNRLDQPEIQGIVATYRDVTERIENDRARHASEERFRSLAESSPLGIFQLDLDQQCTYVNDRWCEITGQGPDDAMGDGWRRQLRLGERVDGIHDDIDSFIPHESGVQLVRPDGETRWCAVRFAPLTDDQGERTGSVGTIDDITSTLAAQNEARRLSTILQATTDLVLLFVPEGTIEYLNEAACRFFEVADADAARGTSVADILPEENIELWNSRILPSLEQDIPWQGETTVRNRSGEVIPISAVVLGHRGAAGNLEMVSITARDMSERKALEARLQHQATHDPLTGLPNRILLLDRLEMAMARSHRSHSRLAVLFLDLDHFKVVNDSLGHGTGDELLAILATRLSEQVRPGDTVARFGGDEFVIVCEDLSGTGEAEEIAQRIAESMSESAWIGGSEVFVTASVGIAIVDDLHQVPDQVLRDADAAMYQAKARGRARYELFDPRFRTKALDRLETENALRRALTRSELRVHYQPVFDMATERVVGVEALLRWEHPDRSLLLPSEFLGVAEESGLIVPIGEWVMRTACEQSRRLTELFGPAGELDVAVNLSARQVANPRLVDQITEIIATTGVDPALLTLEITESILMDDVVQSNETLGRLKALGIGLAIDDFGTGYSSFAYLQRFPVDVLKVDRSFVSGLGAEPGDAAITEAIVTLCHTLGLVAVAEGVETEQQYRELERIGCDRVQGFWKSRPLRPEALEDLIRSTLA